MAFDYDSYSDKTKEVKEKLLKERPLWRITVLERLMRSFSIGERLVLYVLTGILSLSALALITGVNAAVSVTVPAHGGTLTEGEVGPARFINPILTLSQPDEDLSALVYSGLMRALPDGTYIPDLAENYDISPDGTTYTFHLRPDATFQDGTKVTASDVLFTVQAAQNPDIKSVRRADWEGVSVSSPNDTTVVFKLPHAYAPFIENATMGILPKHIWQSVSAEEFPFSPANTHPVGSGPYRVVSVSTDSTGSATRYELAPFAHYALGEANLSHITFVFYSNETDMVQAFNMRRIDAIAGISPEQLPSLKRTDVSLIHTPLPRTFGVFFNQSHAPVLADLSARNALDVAVDKQAIVNSVLSGYGVVLDGPIPPGVSGEEHLFPIAPVDFPRAILASATSTPNESNIAAARAILQKGGWKFDDSSGTWTKAKQTLTFSLATADEPELIATANALASTWSALGVKVSVQVYPLSELNTSVIRPRSYDALLFGEVVGRSLDLFAFWNSTQRNDPGLNLAMYTNSKVDSYLSQARSTTDPVKRDKLYTQFASTLEKDTPAVFLYAPEFLYVVPKSLQGVGLGALTTPSERYLNVYDWYTETERVWSVFTNKSE